MFVSCVISQALLLFSASDWDSTLISSAQKSPSIPSTIVSCAFVVLRRGHFSKDLVAILLVFLCVRFAVRPLTSDTATEVIAIASGGEVLQGVWRSLEEVYMNQKSSVVIPSITLFITSHCSCTNPRTRVPWSQGFINYRSRTRKHVVLHERGALDGHTVQEGSDLRHASNCFIYYYLTVLMSQRVISKEGLCLCAKTVAGFKIRLLVTFTVCDSELFCDLVVPSD